MTKQEKMVAVKKMDASKIILQLKQTVIELSNTTINDNNYWELREDEEILEKELNSRLGEA